MRPRIPSAALEGLLYAVVAFGPFAFGCVEPWSRACVEALVLLLALGVFLKGNPAASPGGVYFWLFPAAVAAFGVLQLTAARAPGDPMPLRPFTATPHETRAAVLLWLSYAAVLWSVPRVIITPEAARRFTRVLFAVGLVLAAFGLLQLAAGDDKVRWLRAGPRFASYYNRDHAANILLMSLGAGIGLLVSWSRSRPETAGGTSRSRLSYRGLLAGGLLVVFLGVVACSSQGALLALPLSGAFVAFLGADFAPNAKRRRLRAGAAVAGAALTVLFAYYHVVSAADAGALIDAHVMSRLSIYGDSWRWWRDAPLFGTGLGCFATLYPAYQDLGLLGLAFHAHSDWIEFALETGLLGLAGALLAAGLAAFFGARAWRAARSGEMRALIGGALAAAAAFAAHSLFEFSFQIPGNAVMFFAVLGLLLSAPSWADKSGLRPATKPPSSGAALLAAAYAVVLVRAAFLPAVAAWMAASPGEPVERVVALARAAALDPDPSFGAALSDTAYKAAARGSGPDFAFLRISLRYALAAAESRPFSADELFLAGAALWRLERPSDAEIYFARASAVRFARYEPIRESSAQRRERNLETLRALKLVEPKREAR